MEKRQQEQEVNPEKKKREIIHRVSARGVARIEGARLVKHDITGDAHPTSNRVPTAIALMLITVSKKNTLSRLSGQFGEIGRASCRERVSSPV